MNPHQPSEVLRQLEQIIAERQQQSSADTSYTARLLAAGGEKVGRKLAEESVECLLAALEPGDSGREHLVREAADVIYHLLVLLRCRDVSLDEVRTELARRFSISGLAEKAARAATPPSDSLP